TEPAAAILTWPLLDDRLAKAVATVSGEEDLTAAKKFRNLAYKSGMVHISPQGIAMKADCTPLDMEKVIARMVINRLIQTVDQPLDQDALYDLLYGKESEPPFDLQQLIDEVRQQLEAADETVGTE